MSCEVESWAIKEQEEMKVHDDWSKKKVHDAKMPMLIGMWGVIKTELEMRK